MKCPLCDIEMTVRDNGIKIINDDSAESPTEVYQEQVFYCVNPQCKNYQKEVEKISHRLN